MHFVHGESWVRRLAQTGGAVRKTLHTSLQRFWDETLCWFGPPDDLPLQHLLQEGVVDASPDQLRARYLQKVMPVLSDLEIVVPAAFNSATGCWEITQALPWQRWLAVSRRLE